MQADFDAIQTVSANGYIVVCAAGNGSMPLDDPHYNGMYDLNVRDSGALLVGAMFPNISGPMCYTNHGSRIDAHSWGRNVVAAGGGGSASTRCWRSGTSVSSRISRAGETTRSTGRTSGSTCATCGR